MHLRNLPCSPVCEIIVANLRLLTVRGSARSCIPRTAIWNTDGNGGAIAGRLSVAGPRSSGEGTAVRGETSQRHHGESDARRRQGKLKFRL